MTEYEMVSAMQGYSNAFMVLLMNFFSILTAYLAAGYLAGHRLTRAMASFVTAMFLVLSILFIVAMYRTVTIQTSLGREMANFAHAGKGLAWSPISSSSLSMADMERFTFILMAILLTIVVSALVGGVYFFYDCRKRNLQATP